MGVLVVATALTRYTRRLVRDRRDRESRASRAGGGGGARRGGAVPRDPQRAVEPLGDLHVARPPGRRAAEAGAPPRGPRPTRVRSAEIISSEFARLHSLLESSSAAPQLRRDAGRPRADPAGDAPASHRQRHHAQLPARAGGRRPGGDAGAGADEPAGQLRAARAGGGDPRVGAADPRAPASSRSPTPVPVCGSLQGETATTGSGLGLELSSRLVERLRRHPPADAHHAVPVGDDGAALPAAGRRRGRGTARPRRTTVPPTSSRSRERSRARRGPR